MNQFKVEWREKDGYINCAIYPNMHEALQMCSDLCEYDQNVHTDVSITVMNENGAFTVFTWLNAG